MTRDIDTDHQMNSFNEEELRNQEPRKWEWTYRAAGKQRLWPTEPTIQRLDLSLWQQTRIILDAGCGDGKNMAYLANKNFIVIGVDASASALDKCQQYLDSASLEKKCLLLKPTTLESLPFMDETISAAICIDVLGHVPKPEAILQELARVVTPGGYIYASVFHLNDTCREGLRMRRGPTPNEYWYSPSVPDESDPNLEHYYHFYDKLQAESLFASSGLRICTIETQRWVEPPHKGYREEPHTHESWYALMQKE